MQFNLNETAGVSNCPTFFIGQQSGPLMFKTPTNTEQAVWIQSALLLIVTFIIQQTANNSIYSPGA